MRKTLIALATLFAANIVHAAELPVSGLTLNTEMKAFHKVDAETSHITIEPELRFTPSQGPLSLWAETPITIYETNHASGDNLAVVNMLEDGNYPVLELGLDYTLHAGSKAYAETTYDFNGDNARGEIEIGVSFTF